jgi:DNA-binding transcriptional LysR family regulator
MELRQLRYLAAVAREGSFTTAAEKLSVVQPAVSQQIRKLEAELGVELLHRAGRLRPTSAGARVLVRAERILAEAAALREEASQEIGLLGGHIAIGSMQWLGPFDLPHLIGYFRRAYPDVELTLNENTTPRMLAALRHDELDLTFTSLVGQPDDGGVEMAVLAEEEMVIVGARELLPAGRGSIQLQQLTRQPFVAFTPGMNLRLLVDNLLERADARPHIVLESNEPSTVRALTAHGAGLAIVPRILAESGGEPLEVRSLQPKATRQIGLAWREARRLPPAAAKFRELALSGGFSKARD